MSVQNQIVKNVYEGNGSTTVFPYTFALNETDGEHVKVYIADESEVSTPTDNFTIDTQLRTVTYPKTGAALPEGSKIVIRRELPNEQDTNLENNGAFFAGTIEREFDRVVMMIQQLAEQVTRAVKTDMSSVTTPDELIAELRAKAQAAVESASAALVSENNAKASEQAAAQSETNAESYKDTTYGYMTTTEAYVSQAETSATTATNKAAEASASASAAAQSKTGAEAAADTAYDYMIEAGASESIATQSATNAANSATAAANSAELASTFAHRLPVGTIYAYAGNDENPIGALLCDGSAVSRTMYPDLFAKIGTTYGAGDGSTTFNLPNLSDNRFVEGSTTAGVSKNAGLPNITGETGGASEYGSVFGKNGTATIGAISITNNNDRTASTGSGTGYGKLTFDASRSNPIYGNSETVQPKSLTLRYFIQAFDGQTPDSALIDITQYAQELANKANITGSNMAWHRDVITTSGTYTAPVTGLYKITVKGGGGGGGGGRGVPSAGITGAGGGEGGTTIAYERMTAGDTATVVIGAGGTGGAAGANPGTNGGDSTVTIGLNTYTGGGGGGAHSEGSDRSPGIGGIGTIPGAPGETFAGSFSVSTPGGSGGGAGGAVGKYNDKPNAGTNGGGGAGGAGQPVSSSDKPGGDGGDGYVWFEYFDSTLNP